MKKILIFYASYGGGHLNAAKSIEEFINANYNNQYETKLIDCMKYVNKSIEKISTVAYRQMAKKVPWAWGRMYSDSQKGPLAHISSRSNKILAIKLLKLLREEQPDLIISTHPFGSQMCSYLKRKGKISAKIATILTDFSPHEQWLIGHDFTDYFFVANVKMKHYLLSQNIPISKIFVTGIPISPRFLKQYDKTAIIKNLHFDDTKKIVLFFAGGEFGLGKNKTLEVFENLIQFTDIIQIIAISGKNEKIRGQFIEIVNNKNCENNVKILKYTTKIPELMAISDLVISKPGGLTTSESLASNLPLIIIDPIPGQEEENAKFLENQGVGIWIRKNDSAYDIFEDLFLDFSKIEKMKKNIGLLSKKHSTENICKILLDTSTNIST